MDLMKKYKTRLLSAQENIVNGIRRDSDVSRMFEGKIAKRHELVAYYDQICHPLSFQTCQ